MKIHDKHVHKAAAVMVVATATLASCVQDPKTSAGADARDSRLAQLEAKAVYLEDRQQINDVYLHYMRGFDRNDMPLLRSAFWPDAQINYFNTSSTVDQFIASNMPLHMKLQSWGHLITNLSMDIDGDVAHVEAYVTGLFS